METQRKNPFPQDATLLGILESVVNGQKSEIYVLPKVKSLSQNRREPAKGEARRVTKTAAYVGVREDFRETATKSLVGYAFATPLHEEISEAHLSSLLTPDEVRVVERANRGQDDLIRGQNHSEYHFDNGQIKEGFEFIQGQYALIAKTGDKEEALQALGKILHAQQDFYAHTNYIELYREHFLADHHRTPQPSEIPLYEEARRDPSFAGQLAAQLRSGHFSRLEFVLKDLPNLNQDPNSHEKMNKDNPSRPLYPEAKDLAERQTKKEVEKFLELWREPVKVRALC